MAIDFDGAWMICLSRNKLLEGLEDPYCINCFHDKGRLIEICPTRQGCIDTNCVRSIKQILEWREAARQMAKDAECQPDTSRTSTARRESEDEVCINFGDSALELDIEKEESDE